MSSVAVVPSVFQRAWQELRLSALGRRAARLPRPRARCTTVFGRVEAVEHVHAPIEGISCVLCCTVVEGRDARGRRRVIELVTANDFLLRGDETLFQVRAAGAVLSAWMGVDETFPLVVPRPAPALAEALRAAGIVRPLHYAELSLHDGDPVSVKGVLRDEPALAAIAHGYRDGELRPTLTGLGGRLEIDSDEVYRVAPMPRR